MIQPGTNVPDKIQNTFSNAFALKISQTLLFSFPLSLIQLDIGKGSTQGNFRYKNNLNSLSRKFLLVSSVLYKTEWS